MNAPIVIIGAGQAGLQVAESLRAEGFAGDLVLIGGEGRAPYHRPPLSKNWLLGEAVEGRLTIRGHDFFTAKAIGLRLGQTVESIDRQGQQIRLADGEVLAWSGLALATGSRARRPKLPGVTLDGVVVLRDIDDAKDLSRRIDAAQNIVVIGGGFIGLEVAAAARKGGRPVIVIEAQERLMARAVTPKISAFFADLHRSHGVVFAFSTQVSAIEGVEGYVTAVSTFDGQNFAADLVVLGVGAVANDELAVAAGLECENGVIVDACGRTSDPRIVAAGDCTAWRRADGELLRLESVQNAVEQGKAAAAALLGREKPFVATPWFWSNQYDVKLQMAGSSQNFDVGILRPSAENAFSLFYFRGDKLIGVDSVNRPGEHLLARKLLDAGRSPTHAEAADVSADLRGLLI